MPLRQMKQLVIDGKKMMFMAESNLVPGLFDIEGKITPKYEDAG